MHALNKWNPEVYIHIIDKIRSTFFSSKIPLKLLSIEGSAFYMPCTWLMASGLTLSIIPNVFLKFQIKF